MLFVVFFVAQTLPYFEPMIGLIGGSTIAFSSIIFPCLFYLYLTADENCQRNNSTIQIITNKISFDENKNENLTILRWVFFK